MRQRYVGMVIVFCVLCTGVMAQDQPAPSDASLESILQLDLSPPLEFILQPVQEGIGRYLFYSEPGDTEVVFKKEPAYAGNKVYRHILRFGKDNEHALYFAFDVKAKTLYLDRNNNLDLTDDEPCINTQEGSDRDPGRFNSVQIEITSKNIPIQYTLNMHIYKDYFLYGVRSGWQGEIYLAGKKCIMSIGDNMDGVFDRQDSFMFDHERHWEVRLPYGEEDLLNLPQWIYFEGQSYTITPELRIVDGVTVLAVTITPVTQDLMDISFEGQYVSRIMLRDGEYRIYGIVDWPQPNMRIPKGSYYLSRVDLLDSFYGYSRNSRLIISGRNTQIKAGGPVKQEVKVSRMGATLKFDYSLKGTGGLGYSADSYSNRATFAIYQGDKKVEGGNFEYG